MSCSFRPGWGWGESAAEVEGDCRAEAAGGGSSPVPRGTQVLARRISHPLAFTLADEVNRQSGANTCGRSHGGRGYRFREYARTKASTAVHLINLDLSVIREGVMRVTFSFRVNSECWIVVARDPHLSLAASSRSRTA